jgi:hypothetical protein
MAIFGVILASMPLPARAVDEDFYNCQTSSDDRLDPNYEPLTTQPPHINAALLRLMIFVVRDDNGAGGFSSIEMGAIVDEMRQLYAPSGIKFNVVIRDTLDTDLLNAQEPWPATVSNYMSAAVVRRPSLAMSDGNSEYSPATKCYVRLTDSSAGAVLSHELGHCLGLLHTFDTAYDCEGTSPTTCMACGDMVCDTAFDSYGPALRNYVDSETCMLNANGQEYMRPLDIDVTNVMAYTWPRCMDHFTDGQIERMLFFIETASVLESVQVRPNALFENKSTDTQLTYSGVPYSSVSMDYNADGKEDLFISMRDNFGSLQKQTQLAYSEVPQFTDRTENDIAEASLPQIGLRGVAAADYDNDGRVDLFAAAESNPRLYHNNIGTFADSASALGIATLADSSYAGAWGDFDRDGQIDLYVCRGAGGGSDPTAANLTAIHGKLLRNDVRASGSFVDRSDSLGAASNAMGASVAASWADAEGDGDLDLFVGDLRDAIGSASSRFYINNGAGGLTESFASSFSDTNLENVNSVVWADMNNDAKLDLVIGSESAPPTIYFNSGSANFYSEDPLSANLDAPTNGVRPVDFDLDGQQDLVAIPRTTSDHRWMFWSQVVGGNQTLLDQSYSVGFADSVGRVDGMTMADFNSDGDADMYFGRAEDTHDYFYRARSISGDDPINDWVGVRLEAGGGNNRSAVGARVRFYIGSSYQQVQVMDGGSGKGGQADNVLICGLGARTGTVSAEVAWPGGFVQTATLTRGQVTTITDATSPGIPSAVSGVYTAIPGGEADLTFTWDTAYSCDPSLDKVTLTDAANQPSQCAMGSVVLTSSSAGVTHAAFAKSGGGYRHTLTWQLECNAPCSYSYVVESATDSTHKDPTPTSKKITMNVCISQ